MKLGLTEQRGWLPATVVIPQMTVPTGNGEVTARRVLPGVNLDFGWEVIKDLFNIELLNANNFVRMIGGRFAPRTRHGPHGCVSADQET